ncbi:MAG: hypothetical protein V7K76_25375 [Nostoc sp.]|uniref:hypothetical protein n=2 Tax=Nostoc sp. TaxID=1180 RepID=UPI002FF842D1
MLLTECLSSVMAIWHHSSDRAERLQELAASYAPTVSFPLIMGAIACDGLRLGFPLLIGAITCFKGLIVMPSLGTRDFNYNSP